MSLPTRTKYPSEVRTVTFDFSEKLDLANGEAITGSTVTVDPGITNSTVSIATPLVSFRISGGTAGQDYHVALQVTTSGSQTLKLVFTLEVRDDAN